MIQLSERSRTIQPQPMFRIMEQAQELERQGKKIIHLEIGDTTAFVNERLRDLVVKHASESRFGYSPSAGEMRLREAVAEMYSKAKGVSFTHENVAIAPANSLITAVLSAVTEPGDGVRFPVPGFPTYSLAARYLGLKANEGNPKAIIVNPESNPLGKYVIPDILNIMPESRDVPVIFDEAYRRFCYTERVEIPHRDNHVYLWSLSKEHAAPGLRIGAVIGTLALIKKVADFTSLTVSCVPGFIQDAVADYLQNGEDYSPHVRRVIERHRALAREILGASPNIELGESNAAFYLWARVVKPEHKGLGIFYPVSVHLLDHAGVAVVGGDVFGDDWYKIRLTLAVPEADLIEGCKRIVQFADSLERRAA